ncbi:MAG: hypothetical protein KC983_03815, partial [Phycisphaerales bacterium]|nr:hypothetical protein [Phycisphaerales bacterium]
MLATTDVSTPMTIFFACILIAMIVSLALEEKLHAKKSLIVMVYAMVSLLLGSIFLDLPFGPYEIGGHDIDMPVYIPAIDWGVITIILGSSLFVDVTSRSGLFSWIAIKLTKASHGDPVILLWFYGLMTVFFSAVLNNVTAMVIVGSLTGVSLNKLNKSELLLGFLLIEGLLTNVGGLLTLISSVPNIIVGTTAGISFVTFFIKAAPYVVVTTVATVFLGAKIFRIRRLVTEEERATARALVETFDERDGIESIGFFYFSAAMLVLFILTIATTSFIPHIAELGMGFVAMSFGYIMLIRFKHDVDKFYQVVDWDLLGFFISLFIVINVMEHAQVLAMIGHGLEKLVALGDVAGPGSILISAAIASAFTDNIPLAAMLAKIFAGIPDVANDSNSPYWWAVIFGANLGGNLTPIGSASTLVAVTIMHRYKIKMTFGDFIIKALPFAALGIALAVGVGAVIGGTVG